MTDRLGQMYEQQLDHMEEYAKLSNLCVDPHIWFSRELKNRATQDELHTTYGHIIRELSEAMDHLKNKPWKKTTVPVDREAFVEEISDVWHFFLQFHIVAGIDPQEIFDAYFRKTEINRSRRATGY